ncbi:zinc ribbon domain-containing protein [Permianibacter sp. IMCC34836]|uniref:FmdB family zinc ribbon protein n=1 Tax=Permianibacter fluminis TaxID=2738515 RepID=UPI001554A732|nr:zinc ribbon domain-containing protein [Permianibacter fluminis]NQD38701.1 zinc ribbon domain-containing protein [Permianibacter fluminis]
MPIYEYRCTSCGHELEKLQKMSDPELTDCPACTTPNLKKLISAAGFQLKGNGWYATDFKGAPKKAAGAETDKPAAAGGCGAPACATACAGGSDSVN